MKLKLLLLWLLMSAGIVFAGIVGWGSGGGGGGAAFDYEVSYMKWSDTNLASSGEYLSDVIKVDTGIATITDILLLSSHTDPDTSVVYWELYKGTVSGVDAALQGYWKLEDTNWLDETANNNDLSTASAPAIVAGQVGNGADFENGSSNRLSIVDGSQTGLDMTSASVTCAAWINAESLDSTTWVNPLIGKLDQAGNEGWGVNITQAGKLQFKIHNAGGNVYDGTGAVSTGSWFHVCIVFDTVANTVTFYINGSEDKVTESVTVEIVDSSVDFHIGYNIDAGDYFDGIIDEVAVWDRALSGAEVATLYAQGVAAIAPTLAYTTKCADLSIGANTESITNDVGYGFKLKAIGSNSLDLRGLQMFMK